MWVLILLIFFVLFLHHLNANKCQDNAVAFLLFAAICVAMTIALHYKNSGTLFFLRLTDHNNHRKLLDVVIDNTDLLANLILTNVNLPSMRAYKCRLNVL